MNKALLKGLVVSMFCAVSVALPISAFASEYPLVPGDFYEMTGIRLKDGGALAYANFLASEWKADQEFAKSKGWIKNYLVLGNPYPRAGEPDLYLISISERLPSGPDAEKRDGEYMAWKKKTQAQMQKESGNRLEIRELSGSSLLQELKFRK